MDVSPIQRLAITANVATRPVQPVREVPAVAPTAQAEHIQADVDTTAPRDRAADASTQVVVAWHAGSLGYVTRIVDKHSGDVVMQTPPEQVLKMVQEVIARLEGGAQ